MSETEHVHTQQHVEEDFFPAMPYGAPARVAVWCACGMFRYRVHGGLWTPWMPWDDRDGPNPVPRRRGSAVTDQQPSAEKGAAFTEACQPYGCTCDGHRWPGVSHMVPCCDEPHIDQQASVLPPGGGRT